MKRYFAEAGFWDSNEPYVFVEENGERRPLDPRFDRITHSPTGFAWGYGGSGPAQLAAAILIDALGEHRGSDPRLYMPFKFAVVAGWDKDKGWSITEAQVLDCVRSALERSQL